MFIKYPKIRILGDKANEGILTNPGKVVIQEKIDGAQFGFYIENNILYFCSHNSNLTDSEQIMKTGIPKGWKGIKPILESWYNDPLMFYNDLYYYGESLQKHTIKYDNIPGFIGYDILNINTQQFLDYKLSKRRFEDMDLPFINIIKEIEIDSLIHQDQYINHLKSLYQKSAYKEGSAEGIVIKRYDLQLMAKIVDDSFKETSKQPKLEIDLTNEQRITEIYATHARIEKMIHKLHDTGYEIEMTMMRTLFIQIVKDILEEEILTIYSEFDSINFKILNNLVSKKCAIVLKKVIMDG